MLPYSMLSLFTLSLEGYSLQSLSPRPSSRCAVRVPAFRSLPSIFNVKLLTACPEGRRADFLVPQESTSVSFHGTYVPFVSYCYALFCTAKNPNSFRFITFRTLYPKHRGGASPFTTSSLYFASPMEQIPRSHVFTGARGKTHELHA